MAQDTRKSVATTVQLPTFGVSVDADGELSVKAFSDPTGQLAMERIAAARSRLPSDIAAKSALRKISLATLERAVKERLNAGQPLDESQLYLAGLQRIQFVFLYPKANDIVIAGPAEGWAPDSSGRMVGWSSRRPAVRLDDMVTALRVCANPDATKAFLGCTIDPPLEGLGRLRAFQKTIPHVVSTSQRSQVAYATVHGIRKALGMAEIRLFGVSPATHFAQVLVEADYRMKCMAVGLEPTPVQMKSYVGSLRATAGNTLQRWWFTPNYECVRLSDDKLAMELVGQGVQLQTEDRVIVPGGALAASTGASNPAATAFAKSFTDQYPAIAAVSPVYAELRNLIDLAIVATWLRREDAFVQTGWSPDFFRDEKNLAIETLSTPKRVACVANAVWSGNRLLVPAGGGVSIAPNDAFTEGRLLGTDPKLSQQRSLVGLTLPPGQWWWD